MRIILVALFMTLATQVWSAEFFVLPGTKTLLVMGETKGTDVEKLEQYITEQAIDSLILKGPGGSLEAGYAIADMVMKNGISITIPENTDCASACSMIFTAGKVRVMEAGSRLGFHLPFVEIKGRWDAQNYCDKLLDPHESSYGVGGVDGACLMRTYQMGLRDIKRLSKFLVRDGISEEVLELIIDTPSGDMAWVSVSLAKTYGLVTTD